jgi:DNA-binding NtrC family response regulator
MYAMRRWFGFGKELAVQAGLDLDSAVQEIVKSTILAPMAQCNQYCERTAQVVGISLRTPRYRMNRYSFQ